MTEEENKQIILSIIQEALTQGVRKSKICEVIGIPMRTVLRWEKSTLDKRQARVFIPKNKLTEEERKKVIQICCEKRFVDKTPKEIVPILAQEGNYVASDRTFYRILRKEKMLNHRENSRPRTVRHKVKELKAVDINQVWSWDITYLKTRVKGMFFYLYMFMDVWSRKIVAWDIFEEQSGENAREMLLCMQNTIQFKNIYLHSDNGSPMKSASFLSALHWLGVVPSFSRPACSNDNAYSESLFKTVKYKTNYPGAFENLNHAKEWVKEFVKWYNTEHHHSGINYVTPEERHSGQDKKILERRKQTYEEAKKRNPERWAKNKVRNWDWIEEQVLNREAI